MKYLVLALVLVIGCVSPDPDGPDELLASEVTSELAAACPASINTWCTETAPVTVRLNDVWAVNASTVFAVGDAGVILRRTSGVWATMSSGTTQSLRGVWAASASDVWAAGLGGTIRHFNGTAWSAVTGATADIEAVWGSGPNDVWFAGSGVVLRWNGTGFTTFLSSGTLFSVSGSGPQDVWVVGENTLARHFDGTSFTNVDPGAGTKSLKSVLALATNDVWVASAVTNKETMHFNGAAWTARHTAFGAAFNEMSALGTNDVWGAGAKNVGHWNGTAWTMDVPFGTAVNLQGLATTTGNAWVVGDNAVIGRRTF